MPPKHIHKPRAWGTRYDTLLTSPPTSPPPSNTEAMTSSSYSPTTHTKTDESTGGSASTTPAVSRLEKPRNESSIFVGSLPSHVDQDELSRQLTQHLSEHSEIFSIKVVADKKGGMCAFIQCRDDEAAAHLLDTLQNTQQRLFMGRTLRYELAHSFRTLLISYRAPVPHAYPNSGFDSEDLDNLPLPLAKAMRIVRNTNARPFVLWDTAALEYDASAQQDNSSERLASTNLFLSPLNFDTETLRDICAAFGPLEYFGLFAPKSDDVSVIQDGFSRLSLHPHGASRTSEMEEGTWEVKWGQRDDCASAMSALRRVPHLMVTWAHHLQSSGHDSRYGSPAASPNPHSSPYTRFPRQPRSSMPTPGEYQRHGDMRPGHAFSPSSLRVASSFSGGELASPIIRDWAPRYSSPQLRPPLSPKSISEGTALGATNSDARAEDTLAPNWSDMDFPPLGDRDWASDTYGLQSGALVLPWGRREEQDADDNEHASHPGTTSPSPSSSLSVQPATPISVDTLRGFSSTPEEHGGSVSVDGRQETTIPPTPEFSSSSMTPVTRKASLSLPQTPQSVGNTTLVNAGPGADSTQGHIEPGPMQTTPKKGRFIGGRGDGGTSGIEFSGREGPEFDPLTVWVGSLETGRWDVARLKSIFAKYGNVEDVDLHVRDPHSFAFVKYGDPEAGMRAVSSENNRFYEGRPIRVRVRHFKSPARDRDSPVRPTRGGGRLRGYETHRPQGENTEGTGPGFSGAYAADQSPRRRPSQDPFRMSSRSPASSSRLSAHFGEGVSGNGAYALPVAKHASPEAPSGGAVARSHARAGQRDTFAFDVTNLHHGTHERERGARPGSAGGSSSVSPPPSSAGQSSAMSMVSVPQYAYYAPPWVPYYGYGVPPYAYYPPPMPMQQPQPQPHAGRDGEQTQAGAWNVGAQQYAPHAPLAPPGDASQQQPPQTQPQQLNMQPPLHAKGFSYNAHGAMVPMYQPEELINYQLARAGHPQGSTPPPAAPQTQQQPQTPQQAGQQPQAPPPAQWYHPMHMQPYPYPYAQMTVPPGQAPPPMTYGMGPQWGMPPPPPPPPSQYPPAAQRPPAQTQQPTPPPGPYVAPSGSSASVSLNTSTSFGPPPPWAPQGAMQVPYAPPPPAYQPPQAQQEQTVGPRHTMNRRYQRGGGGGGGGGPMHGHRDGGYQGRHASQRYGGRGGNGPGYAPPPGMEPSQSFIDPAQQRQQQQTVPPVRMSGSYPGHLGTGM